MAYIKLCPKCGKRSVSSSKSDWFCPHCGENLSDQPVFSEIRLHNKNMKTDSNEDENI